MPDRLPPRPAPAEEIITLLRRPKSGFVVYPKYIPKRMVDGRARFMTKCDMMVGPCACGYTHQEHEGWVRETLQYQNLRFDPLILWGEKQQRGMVVEIPGYWKQGWNWNRTRCDVLVGKCACGRTHSIQESWVRSLLQMHVAVILNLPQSEDADVEPEVSPTSRTTYPRVAEGRPVSQRQSEDRITRVGGLSPHPRSIGQWWAEPYTAEPRSTEPRSPEPRSPEPRSTEPRAPEYAAPVSITEYADMSLPTEYQERVDNAEGAMAGCACSACENRRNQARARIMQHWASQAQMVRDTLDEEDVSGWGILNCNEVGEVPSFCNCVSCCSYRLEQAAVSPEPQLLSRYHTDG